MSVQQITVIINDQIRDERFTQRLNAASTTASVIEWLIDNYGLPQLNVSGITIHYELIRSQTGEALPPGHTLQQIGVQDGEELQLVSPEARRIWKLIEKIKEEIRNYIRDKLQELAEKKLEELRETLKKTKTKDPHVQELQAMLEAPGIGGGAGVSAGVVAVAAVVGVAILVIIAILIWNNVDVNGPPTPGPVDPCEINPEECEPRGPVDPCEINPEECEPPGPVDPCEINPEECEPRGDPGGGGEPPPIDCEQHPEDCEPPPEP